MGDTTERKTRMTLVSDIPEGKIMTLMGDIPDNNTSVMGDTPERKTMMTLRVIYLRVRL